MSCSSPVFPNRNRYRGRSLATLMLLSLLGGPLLPTVIASAESDLDRSIADLNGTDQAARLALDPLIAALGDEDPEVRRPAAQALSRGGLKDGRIDEAFGAALAEKDLAVAAGAYSRLINLGDPETEALLVEALEQYHSREMVADYLSCGNERLAATARRWLESRDPSCSWVNDPICFTCPRWGRSGGQ